MNSGQTDDTLIILGRSLMAPFMILTDISFLSILLLSVIAVLLACIKVYMRHKKTAHRFQRGGVEHQYISLGGDSSILMPFVASIFLLLLFYYFDMFSVFIVIIMVVASVSSIYSNGLPVLLLMNSFLRINFSIRVVRAVIIVIGALVTIIWLLRSDWFMVDFIGVNMAVSSMCLIVFPSFRVASITMAGLFLYDIFWVFFSQYIFRKNVMLEVATQQAQNPITKVIEYGIGSSFTEHSGFLSSMFKKSLEMPIKLIVPRGSSVSMLGLGDIVIPGMFVIFTLRCDLLLGRKLYRGYAAAAVFCYVLGLILAIFASFVFLYAQPALLYIIPTLFVPFTIRSHLKGDLAQLWEGLQSSPLDRDEHLEHHDFDEERPRSV